MNGWWSCDRESVNPIRIGIVVLVLFGGVSLTANQANAQSLRSRLKGEQPNTLPRRPNDQIEGTIWEYKSTKYKTKLEKGQPEPKVSGRFRIEGTAVFDVKEKLKIGPRKQGGSPLKNLVRGKGVEVDVPTGLEKKRIGEYKKMDNGKIKFEFDDPEGLHGTMIAWKKKDSNGVWLANYFQKEGKKTTGKWLMELRAIED